MFEYIDKQTFLLCAIALVVLFIAIRHFHPKTWIMASAPGKMLRDIGMVGYVKAGEIAEAFLHINHNRPYARVEEEMSKAVVRIHYGDEDDENARLDYRMRGFIDENGYIYKQFSDKKEPIIVGYTAREKHPDVPTTRGKRHWYNLWLDSELEAYLGKPDDPTDPKERHVVKATLSGINLGKRRIFSTESKACAATLLYVLYGKKEKKEGYYQDPTYGWNDTALLSSLIYSVIFLLLYFSYTYVLKRPLLGDDWQAVFLLTICYFGLWAIVRQVKIDRMEQSKSIQSQLDLLNKSLGVKWFDNTILICCSISTFFCLNYYDYDFLPLVIAIAIGISKNDLTHKVREPWKILSSYDEGEEDILDEEEEIGFTTLTPPEGNFSKTYDWDLDSFTDKKLHGHISVKFDIAEIEKIRTGNPFYSQDSANTYRNALPVMVENLFKNKALKERVRYIASYITYESQRANLTESDKIQFALDFVQEPNIDFIRSRDSQSVQCAINYVRYPDETLFDQEGDSGCKALLATMILYYMGHEMLFIHSTRYNHSAIAVRMTNWMALFPSNSLINYNGYDYIYCETTGDGYQIGQFVDTMHAEDFDIRIEFSHLQEMEEEEEDIFDIFN